MHLDLAQFVTMRKLGFQNNNQLLMHLELDQIF
jgi:hypothetical protein